MEASTQMGYDEALAATETVVTANAANMHALLACLQIASGDEMRPYREVEEELATHPAMLRSLQSPHTILELLVASGGVLSEAVEPEEEPEGSDDGDGQAEAQTAEAGATSAEAAPAPDSTNIPSTAAPAVPPLAGAAAPLQDAAAGDGASVSAADDVAAPDDAAEEDQPTDYLVRTSEAGLEVLERFSAENRLAMLIATEPASYEKLYRTVLELCSAEGGATKEQVEEAIGDDPALKEPKQLFSGYFISKLEGVGAIVWDGSWKSTVELPAELSQN